jgi:hypothetical protein
MRSRIFLAASALAFVAADAAAQSLGGFPIREPGSSASAGGKPASGAMQIIVDANGPGPYKSIQAAIDKVGEGGVVYVMHGVYNESITLTRSVFLQGDRGPGSGVEINAPMNTACLKFAPKEGTAHAVIANVTFIAKPNSRGQACVDVGAGVFTLKESNVLGSTVMPAVKISGGTAILEKNRISAGSEGVYVDQAHTLSQSFIIDNKIQGNNIGVDIAAGSRADVVVAGNEIYDNLDSGVKASGFGGASLIGNKISNNKGSGVILDKYSKLSLVRYNEIVKNRLDGVAIPFGVNGIIESNEIVGNEGKSIFIRPDGPQPKITNNFIDKNGGDGKKRRRGAASY